MRRSGVLSTSVVVLLLAGCGGEGALQVFGVAPRRVVQLADPAGVTILDTGSPRIVGRVDAGVTSNSWVFRSIATDAGSRLEAVDSWGETAWAHTFDTRLSARVASFDGELVALLPAAYETVDPYHPSGRQTTKVVVASTQGLPDRSFVLDGNFEPEAFSAPGDALFLIEYLPPLQPDRYRVRKLDLGSGVVGAVQSVDGHLQESMRGTARVHALAPDGSRLYTLYTTDGPEGPHAFVHVLDLREGWAHCVDLPASFQATPESELAIAVGGPDNAVVVVDAAGGHVARIDPETLMVDRSASIAPLEDAGTVFVVAARDAVYVTRGRTVVVLGTTLEVTRTWHTDSESRGLFVDPSDDRLWQVADGFVFALDGASGDILESVALPKSMVPPAPSDHSVLQCAC